jgi:tRNA U55 pseudouridine synthase TruB
MTKLFRKKSGLFTEETAVSAENFNSLTDILNALIPPENTVNFTSVYLNEKQTEDILNGRHCFVKNQNGLYKVFGNNEFIGVGQIEKNNLTIKAFIKD